MREDEAFGHRSSDDSFPSSGLKALLEYVCACVCVRAASSQQECHCDILLQILEHF